MASLLDAISTCTREDTLPNGGVGRLIDMASVADIANSHACAGWQVEVEALRNAIIPIRYLRNMDEISSSAQVRLLESTIAQVGLGGLGGSLLEIFLRTGIGRIRGADGDHFEESNLNRQALATPDVLNKPKADVAFERAQRINPSVEFTQCRDFLTEESLPAFLQDASVAIDALGGLKTRQALQQVASESGIPLVTGALAGWTGYVGVVMPGATGPADIMGSDNAAEEKLGCPAPAVNFIASLMAAETVKILSGTPASLAGKLLVIDLEDLTFETIVL